MCSSKTHLVFFVIFSCLILAIKNKTYCSENTVWQKGVVGLESFIARSTLVPWHFWFNKNVLNATCEFMRTWLKTGLQVTVLEQIDNWIYNCRYTIRFSLVVCRIVVEVTNLNYSRIKKKNFTWKALLYYLSLNIKDMPPLSHIPFIAST